MKKRCAYYRQPNGRPSRRNDGKDAPTNILSLLGEKATVTPEGKVSWSIGFEMLHLKAALRYTFMILEPGGAELNEADTWDLAWKAVVTCARKTPGKVIDPAELLRCIDELASKYFASRPKDYILISSLSVAQLPVRRITMQGCTITSLKARGKRFTLPDSLCTRLRRSHLRNHIENTKYRTVRVTVSGRSTNEAADRALNALHLLRALWSLSATWGTWRIDFRVPKKRPLGSIHMGPFHTLHLPSGELARDDIYWYEPDYLEDQPLFQRKQGWERIEKDRRWLARQLRVLPYRAEMETLVVRYVRALDQPDPNLAFLQMWGILETVTDTVGNYDKTLDRAIWPFRGNTRLYQKDILQLLRCGRNRYVHEGELGDRGELIAYLIKSLLEPHLLSLITNQWGMQDLDDYSAILSLPTDLQTLLRRKQHLASAITAAAAQTP